MTLTDEERRSFAWVGVVREGGGSEADPRTHSAADPRGRFQSWVGNAPFVRRGHRPRPTAPVCRVLAFALAFRPALRRTLWPRGPHLAIDGTGDYCEPPSPKIPPILPNRCFTTGRCVAARVGADSDNVGIGSQPVHAGNRRPSDEDRDRSPLNRLQQCRWGRGC